MNRSAIIRDVMESDVLTVPPEASLFDAWSIFSELKIGGAPVVSDEEGLIGVLSQTDLLREVFADAAALAPSSYYSGELLWQAPPPDLTDRLKKTTVREAMSPYVVSVSPDDRVADVATVLRSRRIHRAIVVEEGKVIGIVSALDLLKVLEEH